MISDIIVPLPSSSDDLGSTPESTPSGEPITINYRGNDYNAFSSTAAVTISGTEITGIDLPVLAVQKKSPDLFGINPNFDGVFGFGHPSLSEHHSPITAMDVLYNGGVISNNEVSLQLCSHDIFQQSFVNIGNTDITPKCGTDGTSVAWVQSPTNDCHNVNIKSILINGEQANLPAEFQKKVEDDHTLYSYIQTCSSYMIFPETVVTALVGAILDSGAITIKNNLFTSKLSKREIKKIFWRSYAMPESTYNIDWNKLPSLSITMHAETPVTLENYNSVVTIKLSPKDYIQRVNSERFLFAVAVGSNDRAALGIPFMTRLTVTFDRAHKRIGFGPGCECETATSEYPTISNGDRVLWPLTQLPEEPSTSGSDGTSTLRRLSRLGNTLRGSKQSKFNYKKTGD
ncbi:hypothetical protein QVD99_003253 [Batrachochytrium dendrobatidis]|nr:hypothetical protein QVD99_003253 [Batrachochytrium dendrobatidis]OAJ45468.1 hypothetical protein BDEG_28607 [Batrachochytrium dendrobatidis JEL423]